MDKATKPAIFCSLENFIFPIKQKIVFCSKWRGLGKLAGPTMEECRKTTHRWLVEWLPELSVVEVSVEFQYKHNTQEGDSLDEFSEHCLMVARCAKEGILKEICAESVKRKIANGGTVVRAPRRFGFFNANLDAHWVVNITTGSREAQEITNADKWENDFYKVFWTFVIHHEQSNQQAVGKA